jgi:predicted nuclease of restriction endonuclease-like (RecB) superfamily
MKQSKHELINVDDDGLFGRIVSILEQARGNVVRSVNSNMVTAYWLIGREIVQEIQKGEARADYGETVLRKLSVRLNARYGRGFSNSNLKYFRQFYQVYSERIPSIGHIAGGQSVSAGNNAVRIGHKPCGQFCDTSSRGGGKSKTRNVLDNMMFAVENSKPLGFSASLSWSHYRALLKVENRNERLFYEVEAENEGWNVSVLERQIHSFLFARLLKSRDKAGVMELALKGQTIQTPSDTIKDPLILDFLGLPDSETLHESRLEQAIIDNLQSFLLEMGKGFAFVARQRRLQFDDENFYVDLVFYNCILKCYLLIDLKIGKLTHQDIGQMDSYVRIFDDLFAVEDDNSTIGLILCSDKNNAMAKYSVLKENKQLFASKYLLYLPSEEELKKELQKDRRLIEERGTGKGLNP